VIGQKKAKPDWKVEKGGNAKSTPEGGKKERIAQMQQKAVETEGIGNDTARKTDAKRQARRKGNY